MKQGPTGANLAALSAAGTKIDGALLGTYKFLKPTTEVRDPAAREKRIKEVMHRFMCSFFDESIDIVHRSGAAGAKRAVDDLQIDRNSDNASDSPVAQALASAIEGAATDSQLDVMSGSASGNNTAGDVLGVYDITHNEVLFYGFTNCGSDD
jgi:hypothetical protein